MCMYFSSIHTSSGRLGLNEFFDDEKNWQSRTVTVGRPWAKRELRTRSNEELHKLWLVVDGKGWDFH